MARKPKNKEKVKILIGEHFELEGNTEKEDGVIIFRMTAVKLWFITISSASIAILLGFIRRIASLFGG